MRATPLAVAVAVLLSGCLADRNPFEDDEGLGHPEALLRASPYADLVVRVEHEAGVEPSRSALDHALAVLGDVTDKQSIRLDGPSQVASEADFSAGGYTAGGAALLTIQYRTGSMPLPDNGTAAGVYQPGTGVISMFPESWRGNAGVVALLSGATAETLEAEVLAHELGHALGLVGLAVPALTDRLHPDDPCQCHSDNTASLMYPRTHNLQEHAMNILSEGRVAPIGFDADDLADLAAFREGRTGPPVR